MDKTDQPGMVMGGLNILGCKDDWDEDWFLGLNQVPSVANYPLADESMLTMAKQRGVKSIVDLCCGYSPVSDFFVEEPDFFQANPTRALVDYKPQVYLLGEKAPDRPTLVQFNLREINNPAAEGYSTFSQVVLGRRWDLMLAVNALNYINWIQAISRLSQQQEKGGLFFITNNPFLGYHAHFYTNAPRPMPDDVIEYMERSGYQILAKKGNALMHLLAEKK
jgi:hypothetical protein